MKQTGNSERETIEAYNKAVTQPYMDWYKCEWIQTARLFALGVLI